MYAFAFFFSDNMAEIEVTQDLESLYIVHYD